MTQPEKRKPTRLPMLMRLSVWEGGHQKPVNITWLWTIEYCSPKRKEISTIAHEMNAYTGGEVYLMNITFTKSMTLPA